MPKFDPFILKNWQLYFQANAGDREAQFKLAKSYELNHDNKNAQKYYLMSANQDHFEAQLKLAKCAILASINGNDDAGYWLSKAINSPHFDENNFEMTFTPEELLRITNLNPRTNQAHKVLIKIYKRLSPTDFRFNDDGIFVSTKCIELSNSVGRYFEQLATDKLDSSTILEAIELYHHLFNEDRSDNDKVGPSWKILKKLINLARPIIEVELARLLQGLSNENVSKNLNNYGDDVPNDVYRKRERIKMLAHYNEKCANIYLNWHIDADTHWNTLSSKRLIKIAKRFPSIAFKIAKHFDFSNNVIEIVQAEIIDPLKPINEKWVYEERQSFWQKQIDSSKVKQIIQEWYLKHRTGDILLIALNGGDLYSLAGFDKQDKAILKFYHTTEDLFECVFLSSDLKFDSIYLRLLKLPKNILLSHFNNLLDHRNFKYTPAMRLLNLTTKDNLTAIEDEFDHVNDTKSPLMHSDDRLLELVYKNSVIALNILKHPEGLKFLNKKKIDLVRLGESHLEDMGKTFAKLFVDFCNINFVDVPEYTKLLKSILIKLTIRYPELYQLIKDKLISEKFFKFNLSLIENYEEFWQTFTGSLLQDLNKHVCELELNVLQDKESLKLMQREDLIFLSTLSWQATKIALANTELPLKDLVRILSKTKLTNIGDKDEFVEHIFQYKPEVILEIGKNHANLAYDILKTNNVKGVLHLETQKELAKLSVTASRYFFEKLKNQAFYEKPSDGKQAQFAYELSLFQPSLQFDCGMLCLDLRNVDFAYEILSKLSDTDPDYSQAMYECGNIQFAKNNKEIALGHFNNIKDPNRDIVLMIDACKAKKSTAITEIYAVQAEMTNDVLAEKGKEISLKDLEKFWKANRQLRTYFFSQPQDSVTLSVYKKATTEIYNDVGRYRLLRDYVLEKNNHNEVLCQNLKSFFGDNFFEEDLCNPQFGPARG